MSCDRDIIIPTYVKRIFCYDMSHCPNHKLNRTKQYSLDKLWIFSCDIWTELVKSYIMDYLLVL